MFSIPEEKTIQKYSMSMLKLLNFMIQAGIALMSDLLQDLNDLNSTCLNISKSVFNLIASKSQQIKEFVLLLGINDNGSLQSAENIRSRIPHIIFFTRIICLYLSLKEPSILSETWLDLFESSVQQETSIIAELQLLMGYLKSVGDISSQLPSIFWETNANNHLDFLSLQIDNMSVNIDQLI